MDWSKGNIGTEGLFCFVLTAVFSFLKRMPKTVISIPFTEFTMLIIVMNGE